MIFVSWKNFIQSYSLIFKQKNEIHATIYNSNIDVLESQLIPTRVYQIYRVIVKETKPEFTATPGEFKWTINERTKIDEIKNISVHYYLQNIVLLILTNLINIWIQTLTLVTYFLLYKLKFI